MLLDHRVVVTQFTPQAVEPAGGLFLFRVTIKTARSHTGLIGGEGAGTCGQRRSGRAGGGYVCIHGISAIVRNKHPIKGANSPNCVMTGVLSIW
ncbi:hypothetical protein Gain_0136_008 [Komagataeibacter intermedius TF2]|nr:hypothetical protein Gain_0136_008 [Komagataeibacter intermedius TF2]